MGSDVSTPQTRDGDPANEPLRAVVRVGALSVLLGLSVPAYYVLAELSPAFAASVPDSIPFALLALGLFVVFPATFRYANRLDVALAADTVPEYGVNDRWERRNL